MGEEKERIAETNGIYGHTDPHLSEPFSMDSERGLSLTHTLIPFVTALTSATLGICLVLLIFYFEVTLFLWYLS